MRVMEKQDERLRHAVFSSGYKDGAEFARALGVKSDSTVRSHMNGTRNFREASARRYASKLQGFTWQWLMYGEGAAQAPSGGDGAYARAVKTVRFVLSVAGVSDKEIETKAVAELYHALASGEEL